MFSTSSLTQLDPNCSATNGPLGSLERADGKYPGGEQYAALDYGQLVKQFPTFYISAGYPQGACSTDSIAQAAAATDKTDFLKAESTIQQSN